MSIGLQQSKMIEGGNSRKEVSSSGFSRPTQQKRFVRRRAKQTDQFVDWVCLLLLPGQSCLPVCRHYTPGAEPPHAGHRAAKPLSSFILITITSYIHASHVSSATVCAARPDWQQCCTLLPLPAAAGILTPQPTAHLCTTSSNPSHSWKSNSRPSSSHGH